MIRAAFIDRDGVLNVKAPPHDYIKTPAVLQLPPGAAEAVARLNAAGVLAIVVTNQRGVARGLMTAADVEAVHAELRRRLSAAGARLDAIYVCPHDDADGCDCRKPKPGLIRRGMSEFGLSAENCLLVGDSASDVEAARAAGIGAIFIGEAPCPPGAVAAANLSQAVDIILSARSS
ncbi:MAG: HAD family hydrolase [Myxococcales bacterium]|nr:MAG: HAD family hydrolase [Myxococcales bacterium]